jgi:hypothetical protein
MNLKLFYMIKSSIKSNKEYFLWDPMGYKQIGANLSFADLAISKSLENNRSIKMMEKINDVVPWDNIGAVLLENYDVGRSKEGADAFPHCC